MCAAESAVGDGDGDAPPDLRKKWLFSHTPGSRQTRITVSSPIDRPLLAKMSETNFRSCATILGFLPDFATDFGFLTLGFRRARPPTCATWPGRLPGEGCEGTKFWWRHNLSTLRRCTEFGGLTPLARHRAHMEHVFRNS